MNSLDARSECEPLTHSGGMRQVKLIRIACLLITTLFLNGCMSSHTHERIYITADERIGRVIQVQPITQIEYVDRHQPYLERCRSKHRLPEARLLLGATIGAILGNRVGGGSGQQIAIAAGAAAGAIIASEPWHINDPQVICYRHQAGASYGRVQYVTGYLVRINAEGYVHTVRMDSPPRIGSHIILQ